MPDTDPARSLPDAFIVTEHCALCGEDTGIPIDVPLDRRTHYIDEHQFCRDCYHGYFPGDCTCPQP